MRMCTQEKNYNALASQSELLNESLSDVQVCLGTCLIRISRHIPIRMSRYIHMRMSRPILISPAPLSGSFLVVQESHEHTMQGVNTH